MSLTGSYTDPTESGAETAPATLSKPATEAAPEGLRVQVRWPGEQICLITVAGELDVATAPDLDQAIHAVLEDEPERLVIDLDHVTFLDSTGLGVLVSTHRRRNAHAGAFVLVCHNRACMKVMEITALNRVFTFSPSAEEAVRGIFVSDPRSTRR